MLFFACIEEQGPSSPRNPGLCPPAEIGRQDLPSSTKQWFSAQPSRVESALVTGRTLYPAGEKAPGSGAFLMRAAEQIRRCQEWPKQVRVLKSR